MYIKFREDKIKMPNHIDENLSSSSKSSRSTINIRCSLKELPKDRSKADSVESIEHPVTPPKEENIEEKRPNELIISSTSLDRLCEFSYNSGLYVLKLLFLGTEGLISGIRFIMNSEEPWNLLSIVTCVCFEAFVYLVLALTTIFIATILSFYSQSPKKVQPLGVDKKGTNTLSLNQRCLTPKRISQ